jgi:DNA-binding ferritin-like protein
MVTKEYGKDLTADAIEHISLSLRHLLADVFALYLKVKNFHWHISGSHFRDYHLLLDADNRHLARSLRAA